MSRPLSPLLEDAMFAQTRRPGYIVLIYDIRSTSQNPVPTRINDVVLSNVAEPPPLLPSIVGPRDFTNDVVQVDVTETGGDYVDSGVASSQIQMTISDPSEELDPVANPPTVAEPEALGRWLRQGNVIVIREGDEAEPDTNNWPITFTGAIKGQPGQDFNRTRDQARLTLKALSRESDFLRMVSTSVDFPQATAYEVMADTIATTDMGLDDDEVDFGTFGTRFTAFRSTQFVTESPLVSISRIMFSDGFMPRFLGNGVLSLTNGEINKGAARVFVESEIPISIVRPIIDDNGINEVEVKGLDPVLAQVIQVRQELARASITTGFFSRNAEIPVQWSDDKTQQCLNPTLEVDASIGDTLFAFGSESFTNFPQTDGGSVEGRIDVDGALGSSLALIGLLGAVFLSTAAKPDKVIASGTPVATGFTISVGRLVNAAAGKLIMSILGKQGRGQYRILGQPYEYVFPEILRVARVTGLRSEDVQPVTIENHLINSGADAATAAMRVLTRERKKVNARSIEMYHDLRLEPDDVFGIGSGLGERRYMIRSISRVLSRQTTNIAKLDCFEVTSGVRP